MNIIPYMNLGIDSFPDIRYDYMMHLDEYVTNGFIPCQEMQSDGSLVSQNNV